MRSSREIRQQFLDFFIKEHAHTHVPSSPVVLPDDPTLLFANAGMNQFKDVFLGTGHRPYTRAANSQKCIRAGGKHNDLEDVGRDTYHHTFFEMLGNWSFGDYFKKEAITWAWELLVHRWGLEPARLHATYFRGEPADNLGPDTEARDLWTAHLPADHIHPGCMNDNFWSAGDTGPCGPCSEIHIDLTPDRSGGELVNAGDPRVIELWNLVFIQFNRAAAVGDRPGALTPLPARHVDTGMGFERMCRVLQGKASNYDIDIFAAIFRAIRDVTGARPYGGGLDDPVDVAYRIIADHIRCLTVAISDGVLPGNEGRHYVLRRILRRAVRHGRQTLGVHQPFFHRLVPAVVEAMGDAFPELTRNPQQVSDVLKDEEESFGRTLDRGIALFDEAADRARSAAATQGGAAVSAADAFKLYDTYGFPLDLTQVMAQERGMTVDVTGFEKLMEQQRQQSRAGGGQAADVTQALVEIVQRAKLPATEFVGYDGGAVEGRVLGVFPAGQGHALVTDRTPFYAEGGGQVGDTGVIDAAGARFTVGDTQRVGEVIFHVGRFEAAPFAAGAAAVLTVAQPRRGQIMANHTATHLMNHKLRAVLGEHVQQRGSLVADTHLRFDFSHTAALSADEVEAVERQVNDDIGRDLPVYAAAAPQEEALKIHGLRAVFGEKYPPVVRVVAIGVQPADLLQDPGNRQWYDYSIEFCGGTHVARTGDIEGFVIVAEEAIGKGLRRIEALTGAAGHQVLARAQALEARLEALEHAPGEKLAGELAQLLETMQKETLPALARARLRSGLGPLQRKVKDLEKQQARAAAGAAVDAARKLAEEATGRVIVAEIPGADAEALRSAMDVIRKKRPEAALLLGGCPDADGGKVFFVAAVPPQLVQQGLKAGEWVKEAAKVAGGGGGGKPDMAQAGGRDPAKLADALAAGRAYATAKAG